ncbi:MAG TPA: PEP-CTERM sorting domain-containing protein, partial [Alphaproteobacteria bacterium]|nr:PEP-CTERM sorting domain-containing protein [Alphaproteobacteria bacterium]
MATTETFRHGVCAAAFGLALVAATPAAALPGFYDGTITSGSAGQGIGATDANSLNYPGWDNTTKAPPAGTRIGVWSFHLDAAGNYPITFYGRGLGKNTDLAFYVFQGIYNDLQPLFNIIKDETGAELVYADDNANFAELLPYDPITNPLGNPNVMKVPPLRLAVGDDPYTDPYQVADRFWDAGDYTILVGDVYAPAKNTMTYYEDYPNNTIPLDTTIGFNDDGDNYLIRICIGTAVLPNAPDSACPDATNEPGPNPVPEPSTTMLLATTLAGLAVVRR